MNNNNSVTKKVLVADDEKECCELFKDYLEKRNCKVDIAYDGLQAKTLLKQNEYDYVFLDFNMPWLTALELMEIVNEHNPRAKKIMITGYSDIDEGMAKHAGFDLFLRKPISFEDINSAIDK